MQLQPRNVLSQKRCEIPIELNGPKICTRFEEHARERPQPRPNFHDLASWLNLCERNNLGQNGVTDQEVLPESFPGLLLEALEQGLWVGIHAGPNCQEDRAPNAGPSR